ncbi:hypothetical protein L249_6846 [Ophiocordyceps polyrhachis-furcata BCC 54312]|uniref:PNPLA domain-containing protein n=1 Tax=Ophiocordyceps polyrhachis-furcata BCC 54312 TaxID=1330021 RepID=A0A367LKK8_9HYPO|nr:hypothetical protein L249_6846 [Ophiocordyceps polyrhachis-furcata BCC 54312]
MSDSEDPLDAVDEAADDLFGDEAEAASPAPRDDDDDDLASDLDDHDAQLPPQETRNKSVADISTYRHRIPKPKDGMLRLLRVPKFIKFMPEVYDPETFEPSEFDVANAKAEQPKCVVRVRRDPSTGQLKSNTNIYRWRDGSVTLAIGGEHYEIQKKSLASAPDKPYNELQDGHCYAAAAELDSNLLMTVGHLIEQYNIKPNKSVGDDALSIFADRMAQASKAMKGEDMIVRTTRDPELQKKQAELAEKERMKAQRRRENAAARMDGGPSRSARGALSIGDLEGDRRGAAAGRRKGAPGSAKTKRRRRPEYDSDDDLPQGVGRHEDYDMDDGFLVASDVEEMESGAGEDDEDEALDYAKGDGGRRAKRQRVAEPEVVDEDAEGEVEPDTASRARRRHVELVNWYSRRNPVELWLDLLRNAQTFEEWEEAALHLDSLLGLDLWRNNPTSRYYDWRLITDRLNSLVIAREEGNVQLLVNLLRSGLVRNLGNITVPKLYNRSLSGTKYLIDEYITQVAEAVEDISSLPLTMTASFPSSALTNQMKLDFIHDARQAFGRSTLVLQGGAIFGLCHLGVVKALFLRGLLPRIITGTATGALIAALVAIHTEDELPRILEGDGIDLTAFTNRTEAPGPQGFRSRWDTLVRRIRRFSREGYFLDLTVLENCVRANVDDLTFEEAYNRSKRILNITVATEGRGGVPTLLNYITAPNVLIWTAAIASNASSPSFYGRREVILCKDAGGNVVPWAPATTTDFRHWTHASYSERDSPLRRTSELFNVNHFIVSQARPYLIPFLQSDMHGPSLVEARSTTTKLSAFFARMVGLELRHRLGQLDTLRLLPSSIRRFLVDEQVPAAAMTLVPEITAGDFVRLLETPTRETLQYWILRGERSVWPAVAALRIRCAVENELDRAYQAVRKLKAGDLRRKGSIAGTMDHPDRR